jgi:hypothetical protein
VSAPDLPSARWHGTTKEIGLRPTAAPTAREADGLPILGCDIGIGLRSSQRNAQKRLPDPDLKSVPIITMRKGWSARHCAGENIRST